MMKEAKMKEMAIFNLKENMPAADDAVKILELELENFSKAGVKVVKVVHGYGSHGSGGLIFYRIKEFFFQAKQKNLIKDVFFGNDWNIANEKVFELCLRVPDCAGDEDLKFCNPGISVIVLK